MNSTQSNGQELLDARKQVGGMSPLGHMSNTIENEVLIPYFKGHTWKYSIQQPNRVVPNRKLRRYELYMCMLCL